MTKRKGSTKENINKQIKKSPAQKSDSAISSIEDRLKYLGFKSKLLLAQQDKAVMKTIEQRYADLRTSMQTPGLREKVVDIILSEVLAAAYLDRALVYSLQLPEYYQEDFDSMQKLIAIREAADNHLLRIIKTIREITHTRPTVSIRQAEQVNIAEKQVNVRQEGS